MEESYYILEGTLKSDLGKVPLKVEREDKKSYGIYNRRDIAKHNT